MFKKSNSIQRSFIIGHSIIVALLLSALLFSFYQHEKNELQSQLNGEPSISEEARQQKTEALDTLVYTLLGIGALSLAGSITLGWYLSKRALRTVYEICETAEEIAKSGLSQRIQNPEMFGELSPLASTMNNMFDHLGSALQRQVDFTANASHELRTPISIMLNELNWATEQERSLEEYKDSLLVCKESAQKLKGLADSLLLLARIDEGTGSLNYQVVPLHKLVKEVVGALQPFADKRQIQLETDIRPLHVLGDMPQLKQVLLNLVNNAIKHSPESATVNVSTIEGKEHQQVIIKDSGKGISEENLPFIFDRFYRIKNSISSSEGHGLGLAISQSIARHHGGEITVETEVGKGCRFILSLPAIDESDF